MAIDVGIGELVGSLFFGDLAGAGAAAADVGAIGADAAAAAGLGGLDIGAGLAAGAGTAADIGAGATAAELGAAGVTAGDVAGAAGVAGAELAAPAVETALAGGLGLSDIPGAGTALEFAPTPTDITAGTLAAQPAGAGAATAAPISGATTGAVSSPAADLVGSPGIESELGISPSTSITDLGGQAAGPSTSQLAYTAQPTAPADLAGGSGSEIAASSQVPGLAGQGQFSLTPGNVSAGADALAANAAAGGAAAAAPPSIGDIASSVGSTVGGIASNPLAQLALPAGILGYNLLRGPQPVPPQAQEALANATQNQLPLAGAAGANIGAFNQAAATDLNLAQNFQISPAQAASIQQWVQGQQNQLRQQIANRNPGSPNVESSSDWVQGNNQIQQQALAMQTQMVQQLFSQAMQSASAANAAVSTSSQVTSAVDSTLLQVAGLQVQRDQAFQNAIGSALQAFGLIAGLNAGRFGASRPAAAVA